jgi:uncharacterized protein YhjY with autotransporter beta-barrel domain
MSALGTTGVMRHALPGLRSRLGLRARAWLLLALALPAFAVHAGAFPVTVAGGNNQLAAPGQQLPLALSVTNTATFAQDVQFSLNFDGTGGALFQGGLSVVNIPNVPANSTASVTLTLGLAAGTVSVRACSTFDDPMNGPTCNPGTEAFFFQRTATLSGLSFDNNYNPGSAIQVQVEGENGGTVPFEAIPVTFSVTGPATPTSFSTTSNYMAPATLNLTIDPTAPGGSIVTVTAERTDVTPRPPAVVYTYTVNDYTLTQISPADGTAAQAGTTVTLTVDARFNGGPPDNESASRTINWEIIQDPSGNSTLEGGGTTNSSQVGEPTPTQATMDLNIGAPNTTNGLIVVRATAFQPIFAPARGAGVFTSVRTVEFTIDPFDLLTVTATNGDNQSADVGSPVPNPLVVNVTRNGLGDSLQFVDWSVSPANAVTFAGGASTAQTQVDVNGVTQVTITSVNTDGPITITAAHNQDAAINDTFNLTGTNAVLTFDTATGGGQTALPNQPFAQPLRLRILRNGLPESGALINWSVSPVGAAGLSSLQTTTDINGFTEVTATAGSTGGPLTVTAARDDSPATTFAFGLVVVDKRLVKPSTNSGDGQAGMPNQALPQPLVAQATLNGSPESNVPVNWSVLSGSATITATTSPTDNGGFSTAQVTLGSTPGTVTIQAQRADVPSEVQVYTLTTVEQLLVKPSTGSGDGQVGVPGQPASQPLVALATLNGSPESGVAVNWTVIGGSASITSTTSPTDTSGRSTAQITFGPTAGPVQVQAQRVDVPSQVQVYNLSSANTRTLEKPPVGSGDGQTGLIGQTLPERLVVIARNNNIATPGVDVIWTVSGSATLSANRTVTEADGSTSVQVTFGSTPGTVTVTATRADDPNARSSFVLTSSSVTSPTLGLEKPSDSGDGTSADIGTAVTLSARAVIGTSPQADIEVTWSVVSGSARIDAPRSFSDRMGLVSTVVTLGPNAGAVVVRAVRTDSGASQTYQLTTNGAVPGAVLELLDGNNQSGDPGTTASPLRVRYSSGGQPIGNAAVSWQVLSGSATLSGSTSQTNAQGVAEIGLVFGSTPGPVRVQAMAGNATVTFTLNVGSPGLSLRLVSGNRQSGAVGTRAALPLVVEVSDGLGGVVGGQAVDWTVVSGAATLDSSTTSSGADGLAQVGFRFGSPAGTIRIRAQLPGVVPAVMVEFEATSFTPTLVIVSGNNQTGTPGAALAQDFVVGVAQPAGASLPGTVIRWQVTAGGGTLASATSTTGNDGRASNRLTLGPSATVHTVTASIEGGPSVTFTATTQGATGALTIVSGDDQQLPTRTDSAPMVVELKTTAGVPIRGASLLWTADNASLRSVRTTTDDVGRSSNVAQVLLPGAARITVQLEGGSGAANSMVVFDLTAGVANIPQLGNVEENIGGAIDRACPALVALTNPTPAQVDLRARCLELVDNAGRNPEQVEDALDQLNEDVALAQANAALLTAATQFDNLKTRIAALRSGSRGADLGGLALANASGVLPLSFLPSAVVQAEDGSEGGGEAEVGGEFSRWGFFASGIIGRGEQEAGDITPEYDFDTTGITAGVDYRVNDQWIVGGSLGFNRQDTDLADDGGGIDTDGWSLSGYTTWYRENNWYVDGVLTLGSNDYDMTRRIAYDIAAVGGGTTQVNQLARASTSGDVLSTALSVGRDFNKGAWNFGPYMRATYTRVDFDGYAEELDAGVGSGLGLAVESRELKSMTGVLGGKVTYAMSRDWGVLMPHAQLEWEHEFRDDAQQVVTRFLHDPTGTRVRLQGDEVDANYFNIGFGLSALFPGGRSAFFYYEHLAGSEGQSQDNLSIGVRIEF